MKKYSLSMRIMHWLVSVMLLTLIAVGAFMVDLDPETVDYKYKLYGLHKSFGLLALLFIFTRIVIRIRSKIPTPSSKIPKLQQKAAVVGHYVLYLLMLIIPISGYVMSATFAKSNGVFFFDFKLPDLLDKNEAFFAIARNLHGSFPYILLVVLGGHISATIWHYYRHKENILKRII